MKYIITENQMDRAVLKYLNTKYGDLKPYERDDHPNEILYVKDGEVIFDYDKKNGDCGISYDHIWSVLESFFGLKNKEIEDITKQWVEEQYNLSVRKTLWYYYHL
jgi:hypothetical protein